MTLGKGRVRKQGNNIANLSCLQTLRGMAVTVVRQTACDKSHIRKCHKSLTPVSTETTITVEPG